MIERKFVTQEVKHYQVKEYLGKRLGKAGYSHTEIKRTPLGEKIIVYSTRPGLVVGKRGDNIKELTEVLKTKFKMENPQIEVAEVINPYLDASFVAKRIVEAFERFGPKRFKSLGYNTLEEIMRAGAMGAEIVISGRGVPSSRAKSWRFSTGLLKKSGNVAVTQVDKCYEVAHLKSGAVGIKVQILPPDVELPDKIVIKEIEMKIEEVVNEKEETAKKEKEIGKKEDKKKKEIKKKTKNESIGHKESKKNKKSKEKNEKKNNS